MDYSDELLKDIEQLKKQNENLIKKYNSLNSHLRLLQKNVFEIVEENENLKCCGNCLVFLHPCGVSTHNGICDKWKSDNLIKEER